MSITSNLRICFHIKTEALHHDDEKAEDRNEIPIDIHMLAMACRTEKKPSAE
jgi:hypothetical protein